MDEGKPSDVFFLIATTSISTNIIPLLFLFGKCKFIIQYQIHFRFPLFYDTMLCEWLIESHVASKRRHPFTLLRSVVS